MLYVLISQIISVVFSSKNKMQVCVEAHFSEHVVLVQFQHIRLKNIVSLSIRVPNLSEFVATRGH